MKIDYKKIPYRAGDRKFRADDGLPMALEALRDRVMEDPGFGGYSAALGATLWNVLYQGDHPEAETCLSIQGDEASDVLVLYKFKEGLKGAQDLADGKRTSLENLADVSALALRFEAMDMLEAEVPEDLVEHLEKIEPTFSKCLLIGLLAQLDAPGLAQLFATRGTGDTASLVAQLRQ